jgi:hypothetical protein
MGLTRDGHRVRCDSPSLKVLSDAQLVKRSKCRPATHVRVNLQFENSGSIEIHAIVLQLLRGTLGAEVPLLPRDLLKRTTTILRPTQYKLLGSNARSCRTLLCIHQRPVIQG